MNSEGGPFSGLIGALAFIVGVCAVAVLAGLFLSIVALVFVNLT